MRDVAHLLPLDVLLFLPSLQHYLHHRLTMASLNFVCSRVLVAVRKKTLGDNHSHLVKIIYDSSVLCFASENSLLMSQTVQVVNTHQRTHCFRQGATGSKKWEVFHHKLYLYKKPKRKETVDAATRNLDIGCTFDLTNIAHSKQMADETQQTLKVQNKIKHDGRPSCTTQSKVQTN